MAREVQRGVVGAQLVAVGSAITARALSGTIIWGTPPMKRSAWSMAPSHERIDWSAVTQAKV
ncbi:hypothetical protein [Pseudacidovorax intermedius]|uniref:hypothetical protein n=1 Tax=Pseudacidovorax intermedius TaxID=433924 RepID=UPI0026EE8F2F|nr:hypothetical protein [Pseudacidovorax intermedius]